MVRKVTLVLGAALGAAAVSAAVLWAGEAQNARPETPLKLSLSTPKPTVAPGENVAVDLVLTNQSDKPAVVELTDLFAQYSIVVTGPDKKPAPLTALGSKIIDRVVFGGSSDAPELNPGQSLGYRLLQLNRLYDMSLPGEYVISASEEVPAAGAAKVMTTIKSNSVKVKVVEPEGYQLTKLLLEPPPAATTAKSAEPAQK